MNDPVLLNFVVVVALMAAMFMFDGVREALA